MVTYEAIWAVKDETGYWIKRRTFEAESDEQARDQAREIKNKTDDCMTQSRRLSLSTKIGLPVPSYTQF